MDRTPTHQPDTRRRRLTLLTRLVAVIAMVIATGASGFQSVGAQSGDSFEYDDDGVNWLVEWDGDFWEEADATSADFSLESSTAIVQFATIFQDASPEDCLSGVIPSFEESFGADEADTIETADGDPIIDDTRDYAYELRSMVSSAGVELLAVHVCYQLADDGLLWAIAVVQTGDPEVMNQVYALYDGIEVEGDVYEFDFAGLTADTDFEADGSSSGTRGSDDDEEASPSSRSTRGGDDEDASPSSRSTRGGDDDEDASPSSRSSDSDEDDEDASPSARDSDDDDSSTGGADTSTPGPDTDVDNGTYLSPTYGYELEWDIDTWGFFLQIDQPDYAAEYGVDRDALGLQSLDGDTTLYIEGSDDAWSDTESCVIDLLEEIGADIENGELLDDADGDPFEIVSDDRSASLYLAEVPFSDGSTVEQAVLVECVLDEDSGVMVGFTALSYLLEDFVDDGYPLVTDIIDSVSFAGGLAGGDDEDASPSSRSTRGGDDDEDESPSPRSSARSGTTDEPTTGVDGDTYTSVDYDFTLTFDEDVWEVSDETSDRNGDQVILESGLQTATVTGFELDGGTDGCVDYYLDVLGDRFSEGSDILTDSDTGEEFVEEFSDGSVSAYFISFDDVDSYGSFVICVPRGGDEVLGIEFTGTTTDFVTDEAGEERTDLLDGVIY